jgi:soluble lytic murein transglycosylase-like protein
VFFSSGRSLSVKASRVEGDSLILTLRGGGEIVCDRSVIARIEPDEVPYPEPETFAPPAPTPLVVVLPAVPYGEIIDRTAFEQRVPAKLVRAVIQAESNYQERARSPKGAMGLMQLMPETARHYAVADPYEPRSNIEGGVKYLRALLDRFELPLALAAYNAGEAAVRRFGGIPPYPETREYVDRVLKNFHR